MRNASAGKPVTSIATGLILAGAILCADTLKAPANLDFRQGREGAPPPAWLLPAAVKSAGYTVEIRHDRPAQERCAVIVPPAAGSRAIEGDLMQTVAAAPYRAKAVRLRAWLKVGSAVKAGGDDAAPQDGAAQLWIRAEKAGHTPGLLDSRGDAPVRSDEWTRSELVLPVGDDVESISFGVIARGNREIWIRGVSFEIAPDHATEIAPDPPNPAVGAERVATPASGPVNIGFRDGVPGARPSGWIASQGYQAEIADKGCRGAPPCAVFRGPEKDAQTGSGSLMQNFSAAGWRGKTMRLQAWFKLQPRQSEDRARCWLNTTQAAAASGALPGGKTEYREIGSGNWARCYIVMNVDDDARYVNFGLTLTGSGAVWVDGVSLTAIAKSGTAEPEEAAEAEAGPAAPISVDEQVRIIDSASRNALSYNRDLPDFICTQIVQRFENPSGSGWSLKDLLTLQLGYAGGTEHHKLLTVNGRQTNASYLSVGGAIYQGEFGSLLAEIFRPHSADFIWKGEIVVRRRAAYIFRYEMARAKTQYHLQYRSGRAATEETTAAHHGYVYLDKQTAQVLRIVQVADIPPGFPLRYSSIVLDYDYSDVGGREYLLPLRAEVQIASLDLQSRNELEFRDYRKFTADSSISFDPQ